MAARIIAIVMLVGSITLWIAAFAFGWLTSVVFVSHISMAALVLTAISALFAEEDT